jgi:hypothetical protein
MSQATEESMARASSKTVLLKCVELRNDQFPGGVLRFVNHTTNVDITLEANAPMNPNLERTFIGRGMDAPDAVKSDEGDSPFTIRIDGTDGVLQGLIYNARQAGDPVYATIRPISYDVLTETPSAPYAALHMELQGVKTDATDIVMTFGYVSSVNEVFPYKVYGPATHPGLYV